MEKALRKASEESPSLKMLLELQEAYIEAANLFQKGKISLNLRKSAEYAIKHHSLEMAEKGNVDRKVIAAMEKDDCFNWHQIVWILLEQMPRLNDLVRGHLEGERDE